MTGTFEYQSTQAEELDRSLSSMIKFNGGGFKSTKQRDFILKCVASIGDPENMMDHFGITMGEGEVAIMIDGYIRHAEYGSRGTVPILHFYVLDRSGITAKYRIHYQGNLRDGCRPNPKKTEVKWRRASDFVSTLVEEAPKEVNPGRFLGSIKEKIEVTVTVKKTIVLTGDYGYSLMHIMEDEEGNAIIWTTTARELHEGEKVTLRGTVKDHKEYKGVKQTVLTRCR